MAEMFKYIVAFFQQVAALSGKSKEGIVYFCENLLLHGTEKRLTPTSTSAIGIHCRGK